jgi:putative transposase
VVLMYVRFPLSLRNVEDLLLERGIDLCHADGAALVEWLSPTVRRGHSARAGQPHARILRHWSWHLDEMYVRVNGVSMAYLWRAVDHAG